jgi:regulator of replication initiation timing
VNDLPWDELADEGPPKHEETSFVMGTAKLVPDDDEDESGPETDDEAPPQGDPLEHSVEDEVFERDRSPGTRMDSLQDALASIRERVQSLSSTVADPGRPASGSSQLALYRAATDDRAYAELRRHSRDTEDMLRRLSTLLQDLSLDLRSIVDAARRAIDQTSEQAESSIELGRLLGERIEQMEKRINARLDAGGKGSRSNDALVGRVEQIVKALDKLHRHLDTRLTKLEQRSGVGIVREEIAEVRAELGDMRADVGSLRADMATTAPDSSAAGLHDRMELVSGQLDRTLAMLRDITEGSPDQDGDMVDVVDGMAAVIRTETEAAVEPFRAQVEELSTTVETLTDEVQRLRKRLPARAPSTRSATTAKKTAAGRTTKRTAARQRDDDLDADEPVAERPTSTTKKAAPARRRDHPVDINEPFAPGELSMSDPRDRGPDEEAIRRARKESPKKAARPLTKSRRPSSSSQ